MLFVSDASAHGYKEWKEFENECCWIGRENRTVCPRANQRPRCVVVVCVFFFGDSWSRAETEVHRHTFRSLPFQKKVGQVSHSIKGNGELQKTSGRLLSYAKHTILQYHFRNTMILQANETTNTKFKNLKKTLWLRRMDDDAITINSRSVLIKKRKNHSTRKNYFKTIIFPVNVNKITNANGLQNPEHYVLRLDEATFIHYVILQQGRGQKVWHGMTGGTGRREEVNICDVTTK